MKRAQHLKPLLFLFIIVSKMLAQAESPRVAIVALHVPVYPTLANQARLKGEVKMKVVIQPNGKIDQDSIVVVTGHPMLIPAARETLIASQYECIGCTQAFKYFLLFSFLPGPFLSQGCTSGTADSVLLKGSREPQLSYFENHVTIIGPPVALCPSGPFGPASKRRSAA